MGSKRKKKEQRDPAGFDLATGIPKDKLHYYSSEELESRALYRKLHAVLKLRKIIMEFEKDLIEEAFSAIAKKGFEILITDDTKVYAKDLKKMKKNPDRVYLYCDKEGHWLMNPLLNFVSAEKAAEYEHLKEAYDKLTF
jgi:spore coat polysaccharide biosynthesis predicted glycosyltransferase SpsG